MNARTSYSTPIGISMSTDIITYSDAYILTQTIITYTGLMVVLVSTQ